MSQVTLRHLAKRFGSVAAVDDVDLEVREGELVALLGPSGCGKTTTLRMIAGFIAASSGQILIGDKDVTHLPPYRRNTGMVFQGYALFPHMTVFQNVAFGLEMRRVSKADIAPRVAEALRLVQLGHLGDRLPRQLSGGQQQRVALARALVIRPEVFLLDEPLSNLDAKLRLSVRIEIRQLQQSLGLTTVFVTHDQEEALTLADRLVVMSQGRVQQIGSPTELYERPANHFVADFIGRSNFLEGTVTAPGHFRTKGGLDVAFADTGAGPRGAGVLAIRPEKASLQAGDAAGPNAFAAQVSFVTYLGSATEVRARLASGEEVTVTQPNATPVDDPRRATAALAVGTPVTVSWPPAAALLLAPP
ncbi:putative spermidine/putrescine transport system ATP-binding protein [Stella humosa]|uniref:Putative spermidine/putrescine transport system ATP-binding protein n=1 Tax=Stella humosa TaxID=94 RepID=A0A3N1LH25_9PROT|nr:ABC transporter ATP-binding protein [Stella humosa]ROP90524.1 putative spermidine/putrescine transport system ATP-binding protein [Stella humosa]BBK29581.1 spermidine/putrescine ABC transporter ATPase [Stella humosa]